MTREVIARQALADEAAGGASRQAVASYIREQKQAGRLIERRIYADPARSDKRTTVYQYVPVNLAFDFG